MTEILINDLTPRIQATASGGQTVFTYNYPIFDEGDLSVYLTPAGQAPDDAIDLLTLASDYTVQGVGEATGGTVTLLVPAANGDIITIERTIPLNRLSDYNDAGSFKAQTVNRDFDRGVMMSQQVNAKLTKRGLLYQHSDAIPAGMNILPKLAGGQSWKANALGTALLAVTYEEDPGASTLRSELASETQVAPGTDLIGYYDADFGLASVTLDTYLKAQYALYKTALETYFNTKYLQSNIAASGKLSADVGIPANTVTPIIFNAMNFNYDSRYDTTTGRFTANTHGLYRATVSISYKNLAGPAPTTLSLFIYKNLTRFCAAGLIGPASGFSDSFITSALIELAEGDYIRFETSHAYTSGTVSKTEDTFFDIRLEQKL